MSAANQSVDVNEEVEWRKLGCNFKRRDQKMYDYWLRGL